jgi:hypothetical protein
MSVPPGLPPLNLAASGGDARSETAINPVSRYDAAFNVGGASKGVAQWLPLAALAAVVILWRR